MLTVQSSSDPDSKLGFWKFWTSVLVEHETIGTLFADPGATWLKRAKRGRITLDEASIFTFLVSSKASKIIHERLRELPMKGRKANKQTKKEKGVYHLAKKERRTRRGQVVCDQ